MEALRESEISEFAVGFRLSSTSWDGTLSRYMYLHTLCNMHHTLSLSSFESFAQPGSSLGESPSRRGKDAIEFRPVETKIPLEFLDQKSKEREKWNFSEERATFRPRIIR